MELDILVWSLGGSSGLEIHIWESLIYRWNLKPIRLDEISKGGHIDRQEDQVLRPGAPQH